MKPYQYHSIKNDSDRVTFYRGVALVQETNGKVSIPSIRHGSGHGDFYHFRTLAQAKKLVDEKMLDKKFVEKYFGES